MQVRVSTKRVFYIDLLRCISCIFIVWNHLISEITGHPVWTNIGVQVFLFMSGYLYGQKNIENRLVWIQRQFIKIYLPYWSSLFVSIPMLFLLFPGAEIWKVLLTVTGLQDLLRVTRVYELGHYWFIAYILICYLLTPYVLQKIAEKWEKLNEFQFALCMASFVVIAQVVTLPFAVIADFKAAWISCYAIGYFLSSRDKNQKMSTKWIQIAILAISAIGMFVRSYFTQKELDSDLISLIVQYIKVIQGAGIFILLKAFSPEPIVQKLPQWVHETVKKIAYYSFDMYLVHALFCFNEFAEYLPKNLMIRFIMQWGVIIAATVLVCGIRNCIIKIILNRKLS